jgi:Dynein heavy chain, N-terminal region 2
MLAGMQLEAAMSRLRQVYAVYEEHARNVDSFSTVLWSEVDINKITGVTEDVASKLKKMKELSDLPVHGFVTKEIASFLSSLPLMKDLKSEALRKRHWDSLMVVRRHTQCPVLLSMICDFVACCTATITSLQYKCAQYGGSMH